jgi:hypothetical protein
MRQFDDRINDFLGEVSLKIRDAGGMAAKKNEFSHKLCRIMQ